MTAILIFGLGFFIAGILVGRILTQGDYRRRMDETYSECVRESECVHKSDAA